MDDRLKYFFPKVANRITKYFAQMREYLPVEQLSLRGIDTISGKKALLERLEFILGAGISARIQSVSKEEKDRILSRAYDAKEHIFNILGSGPIKMNPINWSLDLKTSYEWPIGVYYKKLRALTPIGTDIKIPWEISRCHHLLWMSEAYCLLGEESYAEEVIAQIQHWIKNNPLMYSVNWTCAMDVSIRAINWMYTLAMIGTSKSFTDEFAKEVYTSLYQHLYFINKNLERSIPYSNNHYFSNIVGQLYLGQMFSATNYGLNTLKNAVKEFYKEIKLQFFPSGVNYEKSISYHRLMSELVLYPYYMLIRTGYVIPECITDRLAKILGYVNQYTIQNGYSPLIADNDDGRFLPFVPRTFDNHIYLVNPESLENRLACMNSQWIEPGYDANQSCVYSDANLAILKKNGLYLYTSCFHRWRYDSFKPNYAGTHLHSDLLSFVFADGDTPIIIDAGSYCYTSDINIRKAFRTTKKHNTVIVDDEEQNLLDDSAFNMKYNTNAKPLVLISGDVEYCVGEYTTIKGQMTHRREFSLASDYLLIIDHLIKIGASHKAYLSLHFAEGIDVLTKGDNLVLTNGIQQYRLSFNTVLPFSLHIIDDSVSPSYGVLVKSRTLVIEFEFSEYSECITKIEKI